MDIPTFLFFFVFGIVKDQHWINRNWPIRNIMIQGKQNVFNELLVVREKIIFPPLHIKLWFMKQFVKALNRDGLCFGYLARKFPGIRIEKLLIVLR